MKSFYFKNIYSLFFPIILVLTFIFITLSNPSPVHAWASLYGRVYYTKPDGTKVGINGVGIENWTVGKMIHVSDYSDGSINFGSGPVSNLVSPGDGYYSIWGSPYINQTNNPYCPNAATSFYAPGYMDGPVAWSCADAIGCECQIATGNTDCRSIHVIAPPTMTHRIVTGMPTPPTSFPSGIPQGGNFYPVLSPSPGVTRTPNMVWLDNVAYGTYGNGARYNVDFEYIVPSPTPTPTPTLIPTPTPCVIGPTITPHPSPTPNPNFIRGLFMQLQMGNLKVK